MGSRTDNTFLELMQTKKSESFIILIGVVKLIALGVFTSEFTTLLFQPFLKVFIGGELNPWQYYFENNLSSDAFPYHGLMLALHAFPALINELLSWNGFLNNLIFKLPLFLGDLLLFSALVKMFPTAKKEVVIFYFMNPIVFYATYILSQLDIIPTALLVYSIYALIKERITLASFLLGFALAAKFHLLVVIPLLVLFVFRKYSFGKTVLYSIIPFLVILLFDSPFIFSEGFKQMVMLNPKLSLLFDSYYEIGSLRILLPILSILVVYFHFFIQRKVNRDLLNFYIAALYILIIVFISPAPAWYIWLVPFVTIYFLQLRAKMGVYLLYSFFCVVYLVFFIFFYKGEYTDIFVFGSVIDLKVYNEDLTNIVYTVFEGSLLFLLYLLYKHGINSNSIFKRETNLILGIGGDSGVGKTTFLSNLSLMLGDRLLKLEGDGEHKWERGNQNWSNFTHLDPKANNIHLQAQAIFNLKNNKTIYRSEYDHTTGKFTEPIKFVPKDFIAISGLHPFYLPKLRKTIDIKIYINTDEKLRQHWKIIRDKKYRSYSLNKIMSQIDARIKDSEKYIHPQKNFSDLIINLFPENEFDLGSENAYIQLCLKVTLDASFHLEELIDNLDCPILWDYNEDLVTQYLIFKEEPKIDFKELAHKTILNVSEILDDESKFLEGYNGFLQYLVLLLVSEKLKEDR
jgi:uridine kinase